MQRTYPATKLASIVALRVGLFGVVRACRHAFDRLLREVFCECCPTFTPVYDRCWKELSILALLGISLHLRICLSLVLLLCPARLESLLLAVSCVTCHSVIASLSSEHCQRLIFGREFCVPCFLARYICSAFFAESFRTTSATLCFATPRCQRRTLVPVSLFQHPQK